MSDLIPTHQSALTSQGLNSNLVGSPRLSRQAIRRVRHEIEEALISQVRIERAKHAAIAGMLAEQQARHLASAVFGDSPEGQLAAGDYLRALHAVGVNQVLKASY